MKYVFVCVGRIISTRSNAVLAGIAHKSNEMLQEVLSVDYECVQNRKYFSTGRAKSHFA